MKNRHALLVILTLLLFALFLGCGDDKSTNPPTTGTISGKITLPAGSSGDINNTRVAIYANHDDWNNDRVLKSVAATNNGTYSFTGITPGTYYLDAWKDNDNSKNLTTGDFFGVYGSGTYPNYTLSPFSVTAGQNVKISFEITIL